MYMSYDLTYEVVIALAFVFIPVSLASSIYGMVSRIRFLIFRLANKS